MCSQGHAGGLSPCGRGGEESRGLLSVQGWGEVVALAIGACYGLEIRQLLRRFHAFGNHFQTQIVGESDDGTDDFAALRIRTNTAYEGAVNLQHVERIAVQVAEGRIPRAKIVQTEFEAQRVETRQHNGR